MPIAQRGKARQKRSDLRLVGRYATLTATDRAPVDGFDGLSAVEARRTVYGTERRVILTHSPTLHAGQARGLTQTISKAGRRLDEPAATLAHGKTRRGREKVDAEFAFRQLKDPHVVSFSPMHHWTDHSIRVHTFTCVLTLQVAHLMRRQAAQAGLDYSVRALLDLLADIQETVMIYPSSGGRPKVRRMLTEATPTQDRLADFRLPSWRAGIMWQRGFGGCGGEHAVAPFPCAEEPKDAADTARHARAVIPGTGARKVLLDEGRGLSPTARQVIRKPFRAMGRLMLWLSTANLEILSRFPTDRAKYIGLGSAVFITSSMAGVSAAFAVRMALQLPLVPCFLVGAIWGCAIMAFDRWLLATAGRGNLLLLVPRFLLALLIGVVVSTPFVLRIFQPEIQSEIAFIHAEREAAFIDKSRTDSRGQRVKELEAEQTELRGRLLDTPFNEDDYPPVVTARERLATAESEYDQANQAFLCEARGGSGCNSTIGETGRSGVGEVATGLQSIAEEKRILRDNGLFAVGLRV